MRDSNEMESVILMCTTFKCCVDSFLQKRLINLNWTVCCLFSTACRGLCARVYTLSSPIFVMAIGNPFGLCESVCTRNFTEYCHVYDSSLHKTKQIEFLVTPQIDLLSDSFVLLEVMVSNIFNCKYGECLTTIHGEF